MSHIAGVMSKRNTASASNVTEPWGLESAIEEAFNKQFVYPDVEILDFSAATTQNVLFAESRWTDPILQECRERLNDTKSQLSSLDIREWHDHTKQTHPGGLIMGHIRRTVNAEMCTQAWCKFREIVHRLKLEEHLEGEELRTVHLCEAPGAFITSFNHFLRNKGFVNYWTWLGMTLNPYYEGNSLFYMIADDQFIDKTADHWYFGADNTGNIINTDNITGLLHICKDMGGVHFVTADGSIDCANDPGEQEHLTSALHYSEITAALHVLLPGGHFIVKFFTLFEDCSIGLMYILRSCFEKLTVLKPVTSKPGNSEVYVIAEHFKGLPDAFLQSLLFQIDSGLKEDRCLLPLHLISPHFLASHRDCCKMFAGLQTDAICRNLHLFENGSKSDEFSQVAALREHCKIEYIRKFEVLPLKRSEWIVTSSYKKKVMHLVHCQPQRHSGSFVDRQQVLNLPWKERVQQMSVFIDNCPKQLPWLEHTVHLTGKVTETWHPVRGKAFHLIQSSCFCEQSLLKTYNDILLHAEYLQRDTSGDDYDKFHQTSMELIKTLTNWDTPDNIVVSFPDLLSGQKSPSGIATSVHNMPQLITVNCYSQSVTEQVWLTTVHTLCLFLHLVTRKLLKDGDGLLMTVPPLLSRISATLVFLSKHCFTKVTVVIPEESIFPVCYLVALGYKSSSTPLMSYLAMIQMCCHGDNVDITTCLEQSCIADKLLEIIPVRFMFEAGFFEFLEQSNRMFVGRRINYIIDKEKQLAQVKGHDGGEIKTSQATIH